MGGGGGGSSSNNNWFSQYFFAQTMAQLQQEQALAARQAAQSTQQQISAVQLDWLRQYGQPKAGPATTPPPPFSMVGGGFMTPFMSPSGLPTALGGSGGAR